MKTKFTRTLKSLLEWGTDNPNLTPEQIRRKAQEKADVKAKSDAWLKDMPRRKLQDKIDQVGGLSPGYGAGHPQNAQPNARGYKPVPANAFEEPKEKAHPYQKTTYWTPEKQRAYQDKVLAKAEAKKKKRRGR